MPRFLRAASGTLALLLTGCGGGPGPAPAAPPGFLRYGPERDRIEYAERQPAAKRALFRRINADRASAGAPPLAYDLLAAKVGDDFCREAAKEGFTGHWDLAGRPPYLRWALAGGVDFHGQNVGGISRRESDVTESEIASLLLGLHRSMMEERPPADGHRRAILDPNWTHVGIGVAWVGGEFRMTEEFVRRVAEWVEVPAGPVPAGGTVSFRAKLPSGWSVGVLEAAFEPEPSPMTREEINRRKRYGYPPAFRRLLPELPPRMHYPDGGRGDFTVKDGRIEASIPLSNGAGSYYVLLYAGQGPASPGRMLSPVVAARIAAR